MGTEAFIFGILGALHRPGRGPDGHRERPAVPALRLRAGGYRCVVTSALRRRRRGRARSSLGGIGWVAWFMLTRARDPDPGRRRRRAGPARAGCATRSRCSDAPSNSPAAGCSPAGSGCWRYLPWLLVRLLLIIVGGGDAVADAAVDHVQHRAVTDHRLGAVDRPERAAATPPSPASTPPRTWRPGSAPRAWTSPSAGPCAPGRRWSRCWRWPAMIRFLDRAVALPVQTLRPVPAVHPLLLSPAALIGLGWHFWPRWLPRASWWPAIGRFFRRLRPSKLAARRRPHRRRAGRRRGRDQSTTTTPCRTGPPPSSSASPTRTPPRDASPKRSANGSAPSCVRSSTAASSNTTRSGPSPNWSTAAARTAPAMAAATAGGQRHLLRHLVRPTRRHPRPRRPDAGPGHPGRPDPGGAPGRCRHEPATATAGRLLRRFHRLLIPITHRRRPRRRHRSSSTCWRSPPSPTATTSTRPAPPASAAPTSPPALAGANVTIRRTSDIDEALDWARAGDTTLFVPAPGAAERVQRRRVDDDADAAPASCSSTRPTKTLSRLRPRRSTTSATLGRVPGPAGCAAPGGRRRAVGPAPTGTATPARPSPPAATTDPWYGCGDTDLWLVGSADPFRNDRIGEHDNRALVTALLSAHRQRDLARQPSQAAASRSRPERREPVQQAAPPAAPGRADRRPPTPSPSCSRAGCGRCSACSC